MLRLEELNIGEVNEGAPIEVTYNATINEKAASKISWNDAVLKYTNKPGDDHLTVKNTETVVYTSSIQVNKFEIGSPTHKLEGAQFILSRKNGDVTEYYTYNTEAKKVVWVSDVNQAEKMVTDPEGRINIIGLVDGTYKLTETAAPTGYVPLQDDIDVVVDGTPALTVGLTDAQIQLALTTVANIGNFPGNMLPSTGGMGTTLFYAASAVLLAIIVKRFARSGQDQTA